MSNANLFINVSTKENFEAKLKTLFKELDEAEARLVKINEGTLDELDTFKEFSNAINNDPNFGMNTISRFLQVEMNIVGINAKLARIEQYLEALSKGIIINNDEGQEITF